MAQKPFPAILNGPFPAYPGAYFSKDGTGDVQFERLPSLCEPNFPPLSCSLIVKVYPCAGYLAHPFVNNERRTTFLHWTTFITYCKLMDLTQVC